VGSQAVSNNNNDSDLDDLESEWGVSPEEVDLKKYRNKLRRVRELMELPVLEAKDDNNVALSVDPEPRRVKQVLPAPPKVITLFNCFMQEVRGTSKKAKKAKPLDIHHYPTSWLIMKWKSVVGVCKPWRQILICYSHHSIVTKIIPLSR
jgi:hypothetical protein